MDFDVEGRYPRRDMSECATFFKGSNFLFFLGKLNLSYKNEFENLSTNTTEEEDEGIETPGAWCLIKK